MPNYGFGVFAAGPYLIKKNVISGHTVHVNGSGFGIALLNPQSVAVGNLIGTDSTGTFAIPNGTGVLLERGRLGGPAIEDRNIVSGNGVGGGVKIDGSDESPSITRIVQGNFIGTDITGSYAVANGANDGGHAGVWMGDGYHVLNGVEIADNLISGNNGAGVITNGKNWIHGNIVGLDSTGTYAIPNLEGIKHVRQQHVYIDADTPDVAAMPVILGSNLDGVNDENEGNIVAGNVWNGLDIYHDNPYHDDSILVAGNKLGTNRAGTESVGNYAGLGASLLNGSIQVGGTQPRSANVISGNRFAGAVLNIRNSGTATLLGNFVGTDETTTRSLGNLGYGIIATPAEQWYGYTSSGSISIGTAALGNIVANNRIGIQVTNVLNPAYFQPIVNLQNNSIFNNTLLGINVGETDNPTLNDGGLADLVLDYPVIESATIVGSNLVVSGFVSAGQSFEVYASSPTLNGFGQGRSLLASVVEGSVSDQDSTAGSYGPIVANRVVSAGSIAANRFRFAIPLSPDVFDGNLLTARSIGSTSEFSPIVVIGEVGSSLAPQVTIDTTGIVLLAGNSVSRAGSFYDPDSFEWTATVDYGDSSGVKPLQLNADRSFELSHLYANPGNYQIILRIVDGTSSSTTKTINVVVQNEAPTATFNLFSITSPADEGQIVQLTGQFEDTSGSFSATVDWGDGSSSLVTQTLTSAGQIISLGGNRYEIRATHSYRDDTNAAGTATASDVYRVVITVSDGAGFDVTPSGLFLEEVRNVLPSNLVVDLSNSTVNEGQLVSLSGSFIDPGLDDTHRVVIDWGDGTQSTINLAAINSPLRSFIGLPALQHIYANDPAEGPDQYIITVSVSDDDQPESPTVVTRTLAVNNVVPFGLLLNSSNLTILENDSITLSGSFIDPGLLDSHNVSIDWGDGSSLTQLALDQGVGSFSGLQHRYEDNASGGVFMITVRVSDKDSPGEVIATLPITVQNAIPTLGVVVSSTSVPISEGQELTVTGSYSDASPSDSHSVTVHWGDGSSSSATVDPATRTFTATHRYLDNGAIALIPIGPGPHPTGQFMAEIVVTVSDDDGSSSSNSMLQRVDNIAPELFIGPSVNNNDPNLIQLVAQTSDAGQNDPISVSWQAYPAGYPSELQTGVGPSFTVNRSSRPTLVWIVRAVAIDDDGGVTELETALLVGSSAADNIVIDNATFSTSGVDTLLVLGLGGDDTIDGTQVTTAGNQLILDGGDGLDNLFGGAGDDVYYLWRGNDNANVQQYDVNNLPVGPTPIELGNDSYKLKPNSVLTVVDRTGDNTLDFSLANYGDSSGIVFDLSLANSSTLVQQDVSVTQPAAHFVNTLGSFSGLVGSTFGDQLTAASNSTVDGGAGNDALTVKSGTVGASLSGGADDDTLTVTGTGIANLNFGGDEGVDSLFNSGSIAGLSFRGGADDDIVTNSGAIVGLLNFGGDDGIDSLLNTGTIADLSFRGGADDDLLQNRGSISGALNFGGDDGVDAFLNAGSIANLTFRGGADDDVFINNGSTPTTISFVGDDDILLSGVGLIGALNFGGDDGADTFVNLSTITTMTFSGGADDDLFINNGSTATTLSFGGDSDLLSGAGSIGTLNFFGDTGEDELRNLGSIADLTFRGGADDDLLTNTGTVTSGLNFGGDDGIDGLFNTGLVAALTFSGGADDDILINNGPVTTTLNFGGDEDHLVGAGSIGVINFTGDGGADLLVNLGAATTINFGGGADDDRLVNVGTVSTTLSFGGDDDILVAGAAVVTSLNFGGDDGADSMLNTGTVTNLTFGGGADDDVIVNRGTITGSLNFGGDDDILVGTSGVSLIHFGGDEGADTLINLASLNNVNFAGGADDDVVRNEGQILGSLNFGGDDGIDSIVNTGSLTSVIFTGGADNDLIINTGSITSALNFGGDDGADVVQNTGTISALTFGGGADDDVIVNKGTITGTLNFGGDDDILVGTSGVSLIHFSGDEGVDTLINVSSIGAVVFAGGADDDRLENTGTIVGSLNFQGDDGLDTLVNRGPVGSINFTGGADDDLLFNSASVASVIFAGGADDDVLANSGSGIAVLNFSGDDGADVLINSGSQIASLTFTGGADDDVLVSSGKGLGSINFTGDSGVTVPGRTSRDTLIVRGSGDGTTASSIQFQGGYDDDAFENNATGFTTITFLGGADDDAMLNNASGLNNLSFSGDDGADVIVNHGASIGNLTFTGGADDDVLVNDGDLLVSLTFNGGADEDLMINSGHQITSLSFSGGADNDILSNSGNTIAGLSFQGGADDDLLVNDGAFINVLSFGGDQGLQVGQEAGQDRLWNRKTAVGIGSILFTGDDGADVLVNDAAEIGLINFSGDNGSDALQNNGLVSAMVFGGGADDDFLINTGTIGTVQFTGGGDDDSLVNRGLSIDSINFSGDDGADSLVNVGAVGLINFTGGADNDSLQNSATVTTLSFGGDDGDDILVNNAPVTSLVFTGGADDDLLQNNSTVSSLTFVGGGDDDSLVNNGQTIAVINFSGDAGADTLINNGSNIGSIEFTGGADNDTLRVGGTELGSVSFIGGLGADSFTYNATGTSSSQVQFHGDQGDDFFAMRGTASSSLLRGGQGNDQVVIVGSSVMDIDGQEGNDRYTFVSNPLSDVTIGEGYSGSGDASSDTFDFSSFTGGAANLDLRLIHTWQTQGNGQLRLRLVDAMGIENVIGTSFADTIFGNPRSNYIGGADYAEPFSGTVAAPRGVTQWVYLDFDTYSNTGLAEPVTGYIDAGEYVYTAQDREAIRQRVEAVYRGPNVGSPWFDVRVVTNLNDIPVAYSSVNQFATIFFNRTPTSGRPGGLASEIDPGNVNLDGYAYTQVNGLLGGVVSIADTLAAVQPEDDSEGKHGSGCSCAICKGVLMDIAAGDAKPAANRNNFVLLSSKIAAHELGHLLGLRHQDAFGPIGSGLHDPPGASGYKPVYTGPAGGFETFDHIIGSPASIGSNRFNDLNDLFFGEREAIKLAFAGSDPAATTRNESNTTPGSLSSAEPITPVTLAVPNTLSRGINQSKDFFVQIASINGQINLDSSTSRSENDWYTFSGRAGELINIDLYSNSVRRFGTGVGGELTSDDFVDSVVRVWHIVAGQPQLVPYYSGLAENDDTFEPTDSSIVDLILPADGTYYIEVDTFNRFGDSLGDPQNPLSPLNPHNPNNILSDAERVARFTDSVNDTDTGKYQLIMFKFRKASSTDGIDTLKGFGGVDMIVGGVGENYTLSYSLGGNGLSSEGTAFTRSVSIYDPAASDWSLSTVNYGDGTGTQPLLVNSAGQFQLNHIYDDNGSYTVTVTIVDDIGQTLTQSIVVDVSNVAPTATMSGISPIIYGDSATVTLVGLDISSADNTAGLHYAFSVDVDSLGSATYAGSAATSSFTAAGLSAGTHTVYARVIDKDGDFSQYSTVITVLPRLLL